MHIFNESQGTASFLDCDPKVISPYRPPPTYPQCNNHTKKCFGGLKNGQLQKRAIEDYLAYEWHFALSRRTKCHFMWISNC